jgi:hypothetical protein
MISILLHSPHLGILVGIGESLDRRAQNAAQREWTRRVVTEFTLAQRQRRPARLEREDWQIILNWIKLAEYARQKALDAGEESDALHGEFVRVTNLTRERIDRALSAH